MALTLAIAAGPDAASRACSAGVDHVLILPQGLLPGPLDFGPAGAAVQVIEMGDLEGFDLAAVAGGTLLILSTGTERLLDRHPIAALARFAARFVSAGLRLGLAGGIEAPDIPRLLVLDPALLAFDVPADMENGDIESLIRLCQGKHAENPGDSIDTLFVRDLDLQLPVGAYRSERGRTQTVRFSLEARVRTSRGAGSMAAVYSYDLLMDAVAIVSSRGHTPFVETLAEGVATLVLRDPRVEDILVRVEKLELGPRSAGIEIRRTRRDAAPQQAQRGIDFAEPAR